MSAILWDLSENDLKNLNQNVNTLACNQNKTVHDLDLSLSVLNLTKTQVAENHRSVLDVVICINKLDDKIKELKDLVEKK